MRAATSCFFLAGAAFLVLVSFARGGMSSDTPFTVRGQTDFDTALQILNPYGTWSRIGGKWAYTPSDHQAPYTEGRWLYTEFGWYWLGRAPHSWATEHYGYWKRSPNQVWSWFPGPYWLPQTVEIRATDTYIGWRSGEVDDDGNFVEQPVDRFSKTEEWTFVTRAQFANPITPASAAPLDVARTQLENSTSSMHTYVTYRVIQRPGPHPADFVHLVQIDGMLAPLTLEEQAVAQAQAGPATGGPAATLKPGATNSAGAKITGTDGPVLLGEGIDPATVDMRKVKYWVTMSLPTYWTQPPPDAKPTELYAYRPDFFQDKDGIERRISLWFNPNARTSLREALAQHTPALKTPTVAATGASHGPAVPAVPATTSSDDSQNAFRSPLDDSSQPLPPPHAATHSTKTAAPSGRQDDGK